MVPVLVPSLGVPQLTIVQVALIAYLVVVLVDIAVLLLPAVALAIW